MLYDIYQGKTLNWDVILHKPTDLSKNIVFYLMVLVFAFLFECYDWICFFNIFFQ